MYKRVFFLGLAFLLSAWGDAVKWDTLLARPPATRTLPAQPQQLSLAFVHGGQWLCSSDATGWVTVTDLSGHNVRRFRPGKKGFQLTGLGSSSALLCFRSNEVASIWNCASGKQVGRLPGRPASLAVSPDGNWAVTLDGWSKNAGFLEGEGHWTVTLRGLQDRKRVTVLYDRDGNVSVSPLAVSNGGAQVVGIENYHRPSPEDRMVAWSLPARQERCSENVEFPQSLAFSADGRHLAVGERAHWDSLSKGHLSVWKMDGPKLEDQFCLDLDDDIEQVEFSPDARTLVSRSASGVVALWEAEQGKLLGRLPGTCKHLALSQEWLATGQGRQHHALAPRRPGRARSP